MKPFTIHLLLLSLGAAVFCGAGQPARAAEEAGPSQAARNAGTPYLKTLQRAALAYASHDFAGALERLDVADQIQPDIPDTWNMRGAIFAEQQAFGKATDAFQHAAKLEPNSFWPPYNLAQLMLMEKNYPEAQREFEKLLNDPEHRELVQFKIVVLDILQGHPESAQAVAEGMKNPSDTVAYYFAHAAVAFATHHEAQAQTWMKSGVKIFGLEQGYPFFKTLGELGYVKRGGAGAVPESSLLSLPAATPAVLPQ